MIERDDGLLDLEDAAYHSAVHDDWQLHQPQAMRYVRGWVLDIGCGVGRHALSFKGKTSQALVHGPWKWEYAGKKPCEKPR